MNLDKIYSLRQNFTIIALTGRFASGCTTIANKLAGGFQMDEEIYPHPEEFGYRHNLYRKYRIVYNYTLKNFKPFQIVYYKDIIVAFILKHSIDEFVTFLRSRQIKGEFKKSALSTKPNFKYEIEELIKYKEEYLKLHNEAKEIINDSKKSSEELIRLYKFFESKDFKFLAQKIHEILRSKSLIKRNKTLQVISYNQRGFGHPFDNTHFSPENIFSIAELINDLIKAIKTINSEKGTEIVIDSLRNPFEIMFFKQRYAAFYTLAVNRDDEKINKEIRKRVNRLDLSDIEILLKEEYSGTPIYDFPKLNVSFCIQNADMHITYRSKKEAEIENKKSERTNEKSSPYFSYGMQLLKFIALIDHPGLITPSPEERCMQLAYTAKYNSGCISRQVGAAITDENYSIKAIGWNNTPEGHVPCNLRNVEDLLDYEKDVFAFTPYERHNQDFKKALIENYKVNIEESKSRLNGLNLCYCFKSLINTFMDGKNQVHTRSLHAEENAFLQISKYGGPGINKGKLFTTASPCELCSKKAYQLGIKVIYYIDRYPGISEYQILKAGSKQNNPEMRLFNGAIGNAYHWLYEPLMPYKDELSITLDHEIKDITKKYINENIELKKENISLKKKLNKLKSQ